MTPPRGSGLMRVLALLLAALLLLPLVPAQSARPAEAVLLAYHVHPDPREGRADADPFSTPRAPLPEGLADRDGALLLPATRLDGVLQVSDAPEGDPSSALARFRETQRLLLLRQRTGAPVALEAQGALSEGSLRVHVDVEPPTPLAEGTFEVRLAVFEDGVPDPLGPRLHRHVVRHVEAPETVRLAEAVRVVRDIPLEPGWDVERLGVAVWVAHVSGSPRHEPGEVLQAAAWRAGQEGPTRQVAKAVLVEQATATWCGPCAPADESFSLVATQFGEDDGAALAAPGAYARMPTPLALAGLAAGLLVGVALVRRRGA